MTNHDSRPLPDPTPDDREFWEGTQRHELLVQCCTNCSTRRIGSPICHTCSSTHYAWEQASGRAKVYSWAVIHQRFHPAFSDNLPYNVAIVELDEGPRMVSNITGCSNDAIHIGMSLNVVFEEVSAEITLPRFKPV